VGDEKRSVYRSHSKSSDILDQELLNLLCLVEMFADDDCRHDFQAKDSACQCSALPLDQQEISRTPWFRSDSYRSEHTKLADGVTELTMSSLIALATQAFFRADLGHGNLLDLQRWLGTVLSA
jgi:hypothetical protein